MCVDVQLSSVRINSKFISNYFTTHLLWISRFRISAFRFPEMPNSDIDVKTVKSYVKSDRANRILEVVDLVPTNYSDSRYFPFRNFPFPKRSLPISIFLPSSSHLLTTHHVPITCSPRLLTLPLSPKLTSLIPQNSCVNFGKIL